MVKHSIPKDNKQRTSIILLITVTSNNKPTVSLSRGHILSKGVILREATKHNQQLLIKGNKGTRNQTPKHTVNSSMEPIKNTKRSRATSQS